MRHPGYYWLAYDWTNLLPTCVKCNQPNFRQGQKIGKHSRFPVEGRHAQRPDELVHLFIPFLSESTSTGWMDCDFIWTGARSARVGGKSKRKAIRLLRAGRGGRGAESPAPG